MEDDTTTSEEKNTVISEANTKRETRRKRILQNQEARLQKILGPNSELTAKRIVKSSETSTRVEDPVLPEEFLTLDFLQKAKIQQQSRSSNPINSGNSINYGVAQDGPSVYSGPRPIWKYHRVYISTLGVLLSILGLDYFLLYFLLLEIGICVYLQQIPVPPSPPSTIFTLILVVGLKEQDVNRIKILVNIFIWIFKDLSIFLIATIVPQLAKDLLYPQG